MTTAKMGRDRHNETIQFKKTSQNGKRPSQQEDLVQEDKTRQDKTVTRHQNNETRQDEDSNKDQRKTRQDETTQHKEHETAETSSRRDNAEQKRPFEDPHKTTTQQSQ